jgi:hypothetical protein
MAGSERWAAYGTTPAQIALGLATHPFDLLANLCNPGVLRLFGCLLFLPLLDLATLVPVLIPLAVLASSSFSLQANLGGAYAAPFVPYFFLGAIRVLARPRVGRWLSHPHVAAVGCVLLLAVNLRDLPTTRPVAGVAQAHRLLAGVNARPVPTRVLAQGSILPHLGWPAESAMLGAPTARDADHYDLVLIGTNLPPWPLTVEQLTALQTTLQRSGRWRMTEGGPIACFERIATPSAR